MMYFFFLLSLFVLAASAASNSSTNATSPVVTIEKAPRKTLPASLMASMDSHRSSQLAKLKSSASVTASAATSSISVASNATESSLQQARALVAAARASQAAYNQWQINNPRRNTRLSKNSNSSPKPSTEAGTVEQPVHSEEVLQAVRLLGDFDASQRAANGTLFKVFPSHNNTGDSYDRKGGPVPASSKLKSRSNNDDFWMPNMEHLGTQPFGDDSSYQVWRNVADYGAYPDGTDATDAINAAIADGNRCGEDCLSSSVKAAIIYFPLGTYRITSPIIMYYNTQIVGYIPTSGFTPTIQVDPNFIGFGVFTSDVYLPGGQSEWYIEQSNFYRQIRNFDIDLTLATLDGILGVHWQVAQATSISNVDFYMSDKSTSTQIGIFAENGSGGWMSDLSFNGGMWGILGGNQQFTVRGAYFLSCANAIGMIWDWGWTWSQLHMEDCDTGFNLAAPGASPSDPVGSMYLMDSIFTNVPTLIYTYPWLNVEQGTTVITLDNIEMSGVDYVFSFSNGYVSTISTTAPIDFVTIGNLEEDGEIYGPYYVNVATRPSVLIDENGEFYAQQTWLSRSKPSYYNYGADSFFNAKWYAQGDGVTDDTDWIQAMLTYCAANDYILFFPAGSYIITSTIVIPINSYIVGEAWSQIVASGSAFADASQPTAAIEVGYGNDPPGNIEIQDMLFTSIGNLPGLVLMYWVAESTDLGSCAMWDSHFRVGGALGTNLQVSDCPIMSGGINSNCVAAFAMLIIETTGYFENVWAWVADHDLDDPQNVQVDIYSGRGIIVTGDGPNWFWGTASEHSVLYQYGLVGASNVFMSMIQTESPYFQGSANTQAPLPFDQVVTFVGDPSWNDCGPATITCNMAWALLIDTSSNIFINGAGLYSWFQDYDEACVNTQNCQQKMIYTWNSANLWLNHVITIGAIEMITPAIGNDINDIILATDNTQGTLYPWWSVVAMYLDSIATINTAVFPDPVKIGWVAFGDSYAAGIGAGKPVDNEKGVDEKDKCYRGDGGYPWFLDQYFLGLSIPNLYTRYYACSGAIASSITQAGGQIDQWLVPSQSELATLSIIGNDVKFSDIVKTCIVGSESSPNCAAVLTTSEAIVADGNTELDDKLHAVWKAILDKATLPRFVIYQTAYPQFFEALDNTCDTSKFYAGPFFWRYYGEFMTIPLRDRMNALSLAMNAKLRTLVAEWNANLPHVQIILIEPDVDLYSGHRFCEPNIKEPLYGDNEKNVAFFYPGGQDITSQNVDSGDENDWSTDTYNSATCGSLDLDWWADITCQTAIAAAANTSMIAELNQDFVATGDTQASITLESDGSVTMIEIDIKWLKMFHPNSKFNKQIALDVYDTVLTHMPSA